MSLDPVILFFCSACCRLAGRLRLPRHLRFLSMLLLLTIGLKGGVELASQ